MAEHADKFAVALINYPQLDTVHQQLAEYALQVQQADDQAFPPRFLSLLGKLEAHFAEEEALMRQVGFVHIEEHMEDHRQLLHEIRQLLRRRQPFARAYVNDRLPERLNLHITRMDSMLAAVLNRH